MRAVQSLGILLAGQSSSPALIQRLHDANELVRFEVAEALAAIGDRTALTALWEAINDGWTLVTLGGGRK
jgi:HEAT repeat protein